jgi:dTDP-L-rhamnose 4-epimerase
MNILVTGGAGFVGSHLVDELVNAGHRVRVLDNLDPQVHGKEQRVPSYFNRSAELEVGDVRNRDVVAKAMKDMEVVFHLAAAVGVGQSMYEIERYVDVNVRGTASLLDVLVNRKCGVKKVIVASSMSVYGEGACVCGKCGGRKAGMRSEEQLERREWEMRCEECGGEMRGEATGEDKALEPTSVYAATKRTQEELVLRVGSAYKIKAVALRYFNIYGPRQALSNPYTGVCAIFSARLTNGHAPLIYEDGRQTRDFIHVRDVVRANMLAMEEDGMNYGVFNVGTGKPTSIGELAQLLIDLYGVQVRLEFENKYRAGDIRHCYADIRKIQGYGFAPHVELSEGMRELVEWGKGERAEDRVLEAQEELKRKGLVK